MSTRKVLNSVSVTSPSTMHPPALEIVFEALVELCHTQEGRYPDKPETWPGTREVAEKCHMGIYQTRYFLLKMVRNGQALSSIRRINNTLRWYTLIKNGNESN